VTPAEVATLIALLREQRPDPHTVKVSFLRGYDAAITNLELILR
jgi:hypothetical protein